MKKKLLIVSWNGVSDKGGLERVTQYMLQFWKDTFDVEIIDFKTMKNKWIYRKLLNRHYVLDALLVSFYTNRRIKKCKKAHTKVVTQGFNAPYVKADLIFAHGTTRGYRAAEEGANPKWHLNQSFEKVGMRPARKVVAVSNHVKKECHELYHIPKEKICVLENCVDTGAFYPLEEKNPPVKYTVLFSGRLETMKGLNKLVELAKYIESIPDTQLLIATPNSVNTELFEHLEHTKFFVGLKKEKMNSFYNMGTVMFFPSLYEGFGMVTTECLSAGVPVIGRKVGAVSDLSEKGQAGVLLMKDTMEGVFQQIKDASDSYRAYEDRYNLHRSMEERYSHKDYGKRLLHLWER